VTHVCEPKKNTSSSGVDNRSPHPRYSVIGGPSITIRKVTPTSQKRNQERCRVSEERNPVRNSPQLLVFCMFGGPLTHEPQRRGVFRGFTHVNFFQHFSFTHIHIFHGATAPSAPGPPHYRGFTITFTDTTLGRTPPDE
jgi:hypothetical protein